MVFSTVHTSCNFHISIADKVHSTIKSSTKQETHHQSHCNIKHAETKPQ